MTFQRVQGEFPLWCGLSHLIARIIQIMGRVGYSKHKSTGVRAGGARGAAAPPKFGQLRFFGQQEKIWAKPIFEDVSMFFYHYYYFEEIIFSILTRSQRNNSVTFTRDMSWPNT